MTLKEKVFKQIEFVNGPVTAALIAAALAADNDGEVKASSVSSACYDLFNDGKVGAGKMEVDGKVATVFYSSSANVANEIISPIERGRKRGGKVQAPASVNVFVTLPAPDGNGSVNYPLPLAQKIYGELQNVFESGLFKKGGD